ncbi:MAG: hypothetical protein WAZ99_03105, partial [Rectinemataceae bacterium]
DEYWHFDVDGGKSFLSEAKQREGLSHGEVERYCDFMLLREHGTPRLCGRYPELAILDVYRGMGIDVESRQLKTGYAKMEKEIRLYSARRSCRKAICVAGVPGLSRISWVKNFRVQKKVH